MEIADRHSLPRRTKPRHTQQRVFNTSQTNTHRALSTSRDSYIGAPNQNEKTKVERQKLVEPPIRSWLKWIIHVESCRVSGILWRYRGVVLLQIAILHSRESRNSKSLRRESSHEVAVIPRAPSRIAPSDLNSTAADRRDTGIYGNRSRRDCR